MRTTFLRTGAAALASLLAVCGSAATGDEPEWVAKRPVSQDQYIGIGVAPKGRPASEYTEAAKSAALNDIASQITVAVSSDVLRTVLESNERLEEEFQSRIRASATAELEGVQLVDTYEDDDQYWVYYRLSKAAYAARRAAKLNAATAQSVDLYTKGRAAQREGRIGAALGMYARAFGPIDRYLAEPLMAQVGGREVFLVNELYTSMRSLLDTLEIRAVEPEREAKIGRPLTGPLALTAAMRGPGASAVADLPFRFAFTRGAGEHDDVARTDRNGVARCRVQKVTAADRIQVVEASLDLRALAGGEQTPPVVLTVLSSLTPPGTRFTLNVSGVDVVVVADESMFGSPLQQKRVEPALKAELGSRNFTFVDETSRASLRIDVKADVRKGTESYGFAFAFASATVSVRDLETGKEIFKSSVTDVKEGSDTFEKAGHKCLDSLAKRIAGELVPALVDRVQK